MNWRSLIVGLFFGASVVILGGWIALEFLGYGLCPEKWSKRRF